jgi:hypothetical protein
MHTFLPKETARRIPLTRERILSSTKRAMIASVNGIEPNTSAMKTIMTRYSVQPYVQYKGRPANIHGCNLYISAGKAVVDVDAILVLINRLLDIRLPESILFQD